LEEPITNAQNIRTLNSSVTIKLLHKVVKSLNVYIQTIFIM